jgi:hypothetical protein
MESNNIRVSIYLIKKMDMGNTIGLIRHFYIKEISRMTFDKGMGSFSKMGKSNIRVNG